MANVGDMIQVRRTEGAADVWLYAVLHDPATNRVQIAHPGNREDGQVLLVEPADIRTKADLQQIIQTVQAIVSSAGPRGLTDAQIRQLAAVDAFWTNFLPPADGKLTHDQSKHLAAQQATLHRNVVQHYQRMMARLS